MSPFAKLAILLIAAVMGFAGGIKYHAGQDAIAAQKAADVRQADARARRHRADMAAGEHATALAAISNQLGEARENIAKLSGRDCLDPGLVRVLNAIGEQPVRAAAGDPAGAAPAAAAGTGLRYSTDRDTAGAIAICRARFAEVTGQLNKILDIEDQRQPAAP